jgi:methionine synthase I (cobalamin-dependent)
VTGGGEFLDRLAAGPVVFDGGMGSMLIARGLESGRPPEAWNLERPEVVAAVHRAYLDAGAGVITTNTFGATPSRMARHTLDPAEVNRAAVHVARACADESPERRYVALSLGPTGMMLPPVGDADESSIRREFETQLEAVAGDIDLVLIETIFDLREGLIALGAARERAGTPVAVTITFNRTPRGFFTVMGNGVADALEALVGAGADVVGANCSIDGGDMVDLAPLLLAVARRPVLCQPNAGQPRIDPSQKQGAVTVYDQSPSSFAENASRLFDLGIHAVGGCCGTTPEFIAAFHERTSP